MSLQEQLLKAGLVSEKQVKQVKHQKRKKAKQQPKGHQLDDPAKLAAQQALEEKAKKDRELAKQQNKLAEQKAIVAQIKQLIEVNAIDRQAGDIGYQFSDAGVVKKIYVSQEMQKQLANGKLNIVKHGDGYAVVAAPVAEKIALRDESFIVLKNDKTSEETSDKDDPYAEYQIPDDLMW